MATVASPVPVRTPEGGTTDAPFQPLADCGTGNFAFYHVFFDDFDSALSFTTGNTYTVTAAGSSTFAATSGDGGLSLFTTGAVSGNAETIQVVTPSFTANTSMKKVFFQCRLKLSAPATSTMVAGLISTNTTPYTAVVDGIYFKWVGGTGLTFNHEASSTLTSVTIPSAAYSTAIVANTTFDLAFYVNRNGDILAFVDTQLVGFIPQSNIGTTNGPQNAGAVARITPATMTSAILTPTLSVQTNSAAAVTMTADFLGSYKER